MNIFIATGGSLGHIKPILELSKKFKGQKIFFINKYFSFLENKEKYFKVKLRAPNREKIFCLKNILFILELFKEVFINFFRYLSYNPRLVISSGAYASLPILILAVLFNKPIYLHEQNIIPGLVNRIFSRFAKKIYLNFEETERFFNHKNQQVLEREFKIFDRGYTLRSMRFCSDKKTVLIFGGSYGCALINTEVLKILSELNDLDLQIIWITGQKDFCRCKEGLINIGFEKNENSNLYKRKKTTILIVDMTKNMQEFFSACDFLISRAGANTIYEILFYKKKGILIPYKSAVDNHQQKNAEFAKEKLKDKILILQEQEIDKLKELILKW